MRGLLTLIGLVFALQGWAKSPAITYTLAMPAPQTHYVEVSLSVEDWSKSSATVKMPVWTPGSYLIREFSQHVEAVIAIAANGDTIPVTKTAKNTWVVDNGRNDDFTIQYNVYAYEYSVRTSFVDIDHASLNLASICMYLDGQLALGGTLVLSPYKDWSTATTSLPTVDGNQWIRSFSDFDELVDSPIELGNHSTFSFKAAGVPHTVAMIGFAVYDEAKITADIIRIAETCTAIFGEHPSDQYIFHVHNTLDRGGGLEHKNSTSVIVGRHVYHNPNDYEGFLSLLIHEYFHLWNAKRLRPTVLGPFDYEQENYTTLLWQVEGFTSYYDEYLMHRMGMITTDRYLRKLAGAISSITNTPGNYVQPVAESSLDAWIKYYRRHENTKNTVISYYTKGNVIAAALDLLIIHHSEGKYQLDDVLAYLYEQYYTKRNTGFTEAQLQAALEKFAGISMDSFITAYVHGTQPLPMDDFLSLAGLRLENTKMDTDALLGASTTTQDGQIIVTEVRRNSAAWIGGLNVNDEVIAVNGQRITTGMLDALENGSSPGDEWQIIVSRDGLLRVLDITLTADDRVRYAIEKNTAATDRQKQTFEKWLGTPFDN